MSDNVIPCDTNIVFSLESRPPPHKLTLNMLHILKQMLLYSVLRSGCWAWVSL